MSDSQSGFCESVIGTDTYADAMSAKKTLYEKSSCHTLDRENMRAQREECGVGALNEEWRLAVDRQFNITHWPYVQDNQIYQCVQRFFSDSYVNESLDGANDKIKIATLLLLALNIVLIS